MGSIDGGASAKDDGELRKPVTVREIEKILHSIDTSKAPKPDSFSGCFYKYY